MDDKMLTSRGIRNNFTPSLLVFVVGICFINTISAQEYWGYRVNDSKSRYVESITALNGGFIVMDVEYGNNKPRMLYYNSGGRLCAEKILEFDVNGYNYDPIKVLVDKDKILLFIGKINSIDSLNYGNIFDIAIIDTCFNALDYKKYFLPFDKDTTISQFWYNINGFNKIGEKYIAVGQRSKLNSNEFTNSLYVELDSSLKVIDIRKSNLLIGEILSKNVEYGRYYYSSNSNDQYSKPAKIIYDKKAFGIDTIYVFNGVNEISYGAAFLENKYGILANLSFNNENGSFAGHGFISEISDSFTFKFLSDSILRSEVASANYFNKGFYVFEFHILDNNYSDEQIQVHYYLNNGKKMYSKKLLGYGNVTPVIGYWSSAKLRDAEVFGNKLALGGHYSKGNPIDFNWDSYFGVLDTTLEMMQVDSTYKNEVCYSPHFIDTLTFAASEKVIIPNDTLKSLEYVLKVIPMRKSVKYSTNISRYKIDESKIIVQSLEKGWELKGLNDHLESDCFYQVIDMSGRVIREGKLGRNHTFIEYPNQNGIYTLRIMTTKGLIIKKLISMRY